jgi:hypothetical protein
MNFFHSKLRASGGRILPSKALVRVVTGLSAHTHRVMGCFYLLRYFFIPYYVSFLSICDSFIFFDDFLVVFFFSFIIFPSFMF